ncbi:hypothetical protein EE612_046215, partial [Oryza sativa]
NPTPPSKMSKAITTREVSPLVIRHILTPAETNEISKGAI